ncbi:MAG: response regulator [Kangiellaceae bacterium]
MMNTIDAQKIKRVLLIDDDIDVLSTYEDILEENGLDCVSCSDGISGIERLKKEAFDLVIVDSDMPDLDGSTVSRIVRFGLGKRYIPIVLISGLSIEFDELECLKFGFNGFLRKPVTNESLMSLINNSIANFKVDGISSWTGSL